jgi:hypothetical protein
MLQDRPVAICDTYAAIINTPYSAAKNYLWAFIDVPAGQELELTRARIHGLMTDLSYNAASQLFYIIAHLQQVPIGVGDRGDEIKNFNSDILKYQSPGFNNVYAYTSPAPLIQDLGRAPVDILPKPLKYKGACRIALVINASMSYMLAWAELSGVFTAIEVNKNSRFERPRVAGQAVKTSLGYATKQSSAVLSPIHAIAEINPQSGVASINLGADLPEVWAVHPQPKRFRRGYMGSVICCGHARESGLNFVGNDPDDVQYFAQGLSGY